MLIYSDFPQGFEAPGTFQAHLLLPKFRFEFLDTDQIQDKILEQAGIEYGFFYLTGISGKGKSESAVSRCKTISTVQKLLGGKYKIELLWYIGKCDVRRFGQLRRQIGEITESSLTKQIRELETDVFILRHDFCEVPPRVEYTLTELGESFLSVLDCMKAWGDENLPK